MLFENLSLNNMCISKYMDKNIAKFKHNEDLEKIIDSFVISNHEAVLVFNDDFKELLGVLSPKDILKISKLKMSIKDYINKYDKRAKHIIKQNKRVEEVVNIMISQNLQFIPIENDDGDIIGIISSDKLLRIYSDNFCKEYNMFEMILDNINDGIAVVDKNCITLFWNKGAEDLYKIPKEKVVGRPITEHFPNAILPKAIKEERIFDNVYNSPKENSHNIISARPLYHGNELIGAVSCDRDISEFIRLSKILNKTQMNLEILEQEVSTLSENRFTFEQIVGENPEFKEAVNLCKNVAKSNINVLITGESGTGKEVFSRAIHIESGRKGRFIPINCSAIPSDLMESELFGYEGGAFTGALRKGKIGKFELAHNGTLFLDEIGDMPLHMQPKILRVLEDGVIYRIGSEKAIQVDVRIIAATNRDLKKMVDEGTFRKDLYYRLNSIVVNLPPLRERRDDIPLLVKKYFQHYCMAYRTNIPEIPDDIMKILMDYSWEGNIRELKNIVERIVILVKNNNAKKVSIDFLPSSIIEKSKENLTHLENLDLNAITEKTEKEIIKKAMAICNGNKAKAAKLLKIPRSTLYFKLDKYNISV